MSSPIGEEGSWRQTPKPYQQNCWARIACKANIFFTCLQVYDTLNRHGPWPIWCLLRRGGKKSKSVWEHLIHRPLCQACKNKHLKCQLVLQFGCWGNALVNGAFLEMTSSACRKNRDCGDGGRGSLLLGVLITRVTPCLVGRLLSTLALFLQRMLSTFSHGGPELFLWLSKLNICGNMARYGNAQWLSKWALDHLKNITLNSLRWVQFTDQHTFDLCYCCHILYN